MSLYRDYASSVGLPQQRVRSKVDATPNGTPAKKSLKTTDEQVPRKATSDTESTYASSCASVDDMSNPVDREDPYVMRVHTELEGWVDSENDKYQGMIWTRPMDSTKYQNVMDAAVFAIGDEGSFDYKVDVDPQEPNFDAAADGVLAECGRYLPACLVAQIRKDIHHMGNVVLQMMLKKKCPFKLQVKIEAFGQHGCVRWHKDRYIGRAITAYCGAGTMYTPTKNIDWNDKCCLPAMKEDRVYNVNAGDILFIKGSMFPTRAHSLIHKSPEPAWTRDGRILHRLLLKVDVAPVD